MKLYLYIVLCICSLQVNFAKQANIHCGAFAKNFATIDGEKSDLGKFDKMDVHHVDHATWENELTFITSDNENLEQDFEPVPNLKFKAIHPITNWNVSEIIDISTLVEPAQFKRTLVLLTAFDAYLFILFEDFRL